MSGINWTKEQLDVIASIDNNTLVSASAGSGKTAVMLERIMRLISGGDGRAPIPLRRIMIATFNESVAAELKNKINAALFKLIESGSGDRDFLRMQIEDLPLADISTLHAFCGMLIRSNFEYLDIQPSYSIVDEDEKNTLFGKAMQTVLKKYIGGGDYVADVLVDYFGGEKSFEKTLAKTYSFLEAQLDREGFLEQIALSSYSDDFNTTALARKYISDVHSRCIELLSEGYKKRDFFEQSGMDKRVEHISLSLNFLQVVDRTKNVRELCDAIVLAPSIPNVPVSKRGDDVDKSVGEDYKEYNSAYKDFVNGIKIVFGDGYEKCQERIAAVRPYLSKLVDILSDTSKEYSALKKKDNKMDFADLEYYAVKLLQDDGIAEEISRKYDYICVDEYQDINAVQEYIIKRVSNGKNLFMVGDVKQSIYQFRMTDPQIFLGKYRRYKDDPSLGSPFSLNCNYRSGKEVIDFVNAVFDRIMTSDLGGVDYRRESRLAQGNLNYDPQDDMPIRISGFSKSCGEVDVPVGEDGVYSVRDSLSLEKEGAYEEGLFIAGQISSIVGKKRIQVAMPDGSMGYREIKFSDIAILCSKRSDGVEKILGALRAAGIPVDSANISSEQFNPSIGLMIDFIKIIDNYRQDIPLVSVLTSGVFSRLGYRDVAQIKRAYRGEKFFCDSTEKYAAEKSDRIAEDLKMFYAMLDKYRFISQFSTVASLIRRVLADYDYRAFALSRKDGRNEYDGLERFIDKLDGRPYNSSVSAFAQAADNSDSFGAIAAAGGAQGDFVKTSTIHASKGLEYPIVFIVDAAKQVNLSDANTAQIICDKEYGFAIKDIDDLERSYAASAPMEIIRKIKTKELTEEFMRLFYVALTRARNRLYITATTDKTLGEKSAAKPRSMWDWLNNIACEDRGFAEKYYFSEATREDGADDIAQTKRFFRTPSDEDMIFFSDALTKKYQHNDATKMPVKHTVTSVNDEYYNSRFGKNALRPYDSESLVESVKDADVEDAPELLSRADEGIAYHRVLECIDYDCYTVADVEEKLSEMTEKGLLTERQRAVVDATSILECLESDVMRAAGKYPHYREKQFMLDLPADEFLDTEVKDRVLLQGTVDLFIRGREKGGENILVDFKYSKRSKEQIKERYSRQLQLYSKAVEECLGEPVDKKIIFVLGRNIAIET